MEDLRGRRLAPAARRRQRRPRPRRAGRPGQGRRPQRLARRAGQPALRPRRAAAPGSCHGRARRPRPDHPAGYPATSQLSAWHSTGTLLLAAATRVPRAHHIDRITDDDGLAFFLGLTALPKATHLSTYSYRARRESSRTLLTGLVRRLRELGLATGREGFNCDFHAIRHHGDDPALEEHYVPSRSQRTRSVLTFFANDHASSEMVYANADITKTEQAAEIIAFADYWRATTGTDPGLLAFDSQLTTYKILEELSGRRITWLTLRQRGKSELARLAALPASAWKHATIERAGRYRHPQLHEDTITLKGISVPVRQVAIKNIGRDEPTLLITNGGAATAKDLFARYAEGGSPAWLVALVP